MPLVRADSSGVRSGLRVIVEALEAEAKRSVAVASKVAENAAKQTTEWKDGEETNPDGSPRRHGVHTRDTIEGGSSGLRGYVEAAGAARFLEDGTRPHVILPRRRHFLRFWVNGEGPIFARRVNHPGTRATLFLRAAATEGAVYLSWKLKQDARQAIRRGGLAP
jgi:hypothetical protein